LGNFTNKPMEKNKQQTAVGWYDNEIGKLFDQFLMGKIKIYDFQNQRLKLEKQAKEMEKEQIIEAFEIGIQSEFFHQTFNAPCKDGEQYYTETYKQ